MLKEKYVSQWSPYLSVKKSKDQVDSKRKDME